MKVVILAGGFGTRISEESHLLPKPMITIGDKPILWHIMKYYSSFGFNEFIILAGYRQYVIKEYFNNYFLHNSDVTFDYSIENKLIIHDHKNEKWKVTILDTGLNTMTGGRVLRARDYLPDKFFLTYGDGVSNVDLNKLLKQHNEDNSLLTLTAIKPMGRFGALEIKKQLISSFREKSSNDESWINGGFMVVEKRLLEFIKGDNDILEQDVFNRLIEIQQMAAYKHDGFWQCMDTLRDREKLEDLLKENNAPWEIWNV
jgi:glucose-1-phosphate cytidylyltransferase